MDIRTKSSSEDSMDSGEETSSPCIRIVSYDEAFSKAGFGLWHWIILLPCGWAIASASIENLCISFIIEPIRDTMKVSHAQLTSLTFALFCGMMVGGYFWGSLADIYGRRRTMCFSLTINAVLGGLSALSQSFWLLIFLRFCSGFGAGGSFPACYTYFSEFQPANRRGAMISTLAMCWMVGNLIIGLMALGLLPESQTVKLLSPYGDQWRLFVIVCAIPSLTSAFFFYFLPESPRFLYVRHHLNESLNVLKTVYDWNHWRHRTSSFDIHELHPYNVTEDENIDEELQHLLQVNSNTTEVRNERIFPRSGAGYARNKLCQGLKENFSLWISQMAQIYAPVRRSPSIVITIMSIITAFCSYGMGMWTPVLMERTEMYGGSPCRGNTGNETQSESISNDPAKMYVDILIGFLAQIPGSIIVILLMDKIGAKVMFIASSYLSGISALLFWLVDSKTSVIIMNGLFNAVSVGTWDALDVLLIELYPTNIRSAATGNASGLGRLGSVGGTAIFGLFMDLDCSVPILTVFALSTLCATVTFKLPSTRNASLQ